MAWMPSADTIFALSSGAGKSGVAVIRISGAQAFAALEQLSQRPLPKSRIATLGRLYMADGALLDTALMLTFPAPASFTGEDVVELHIHGSRAIIRMCLQQLSAIPGLRLAQAGEFTRRAFDAGKFDLLEVEAIADVIDAETEAQARQALRQMSGHMGKAFALLRSQITEALALLEAYIDFPEEDIPESVIQQVRTATKDFIDSVGAILADARVGERIRDGFRVAIIGAPNVGKSSLLNALAKRDAAIVSPIAGTTRDVIELHMDIAGYPVILSDTAGIREAGDDVEQQGITLAMHRLKQADIALYCVDASREAETFAAIAPLLAAHADIPAILCVNKMDLMVDHSLAPATALGASDYRTIRISALQKTYLDGLERLLEQAIAELIPLEEPLITQARHRHLLEQAKTHALNSGKPLPLELWCEELRLAAEAVGKITGKILADELLGLIFSRFCIGK